MKDGGKCTCTTGGAKAVVTVTCKKDSSGAFSGCTGSQTSGSLTTPAPVAEKNPALLSAFITSCAKKAAGKYAQRDGVVTDAKIYKPNGVNYGDAQCSDLAMGCMRNANKHGFNVNRGHRGAVSGMGGSWEWSGFGNAGGETVDYRQAKAGDIAQFSYWKEPSRSTGIKHTAVVTAAFGQGSCGSDGLEVLDQNPSPVIKNCYHPNLKTGGKMIIYRLESIPLDSTFPSSPNSNGATPAPSPTPAPSAPAETPAPESPTTAGGSLPTCADDHAGLVAEAKAQNQGGIKGCKDAAGYCQDPQYGTLVSMFCPKTCHSCPTSCADDHGGLAEEIIGWTGCKDGKDYCQDNQYGALVRGFCPKTCSVCTRLYINVGDEYSSYVKELQNDGPENEGDAFKISAFSLGAVAAAAMIVGMLGFGIWRMSQISTRAGRVALITEDENDLEVTDDAGLE